MSESLFSEADYPQSKAESYAVRGTKFPEVFKDERGIEYILVRGQRLWISHGIMRSSDAVQVHCDSYGTIYVMPTFEVRSIFQNYSCGEHVVDGRVEGVVGATSLGYKMPQYLVKCCRQLNTRECVAQNKNTGVLGAAVQRLVDKHRIEVDRLCFAALGACSDKYPEFVAPSFSRDSNARNGPDGCAHAYQEVKTDYKAGDTGNFYFEFAERNPKKLH